MCEGARIILLLKGLPVALLALGLADLASAQYAGPAILSRGEAPGSISLPTIKFRPFLEAAAIYSTGLTAFSVSSTGEIANSSSAGTRLAFGLSGHHRWRRSDLSLDYRGSMSHYLRQTYYDGMSHSRLLGFRHDINRRAVLTVSQSAGMFTRDFGLLGIPQASLYDPGSAYIPTTDYFDNRTIYFTSNANLLYRKSARTTFSMGGIALVNRRRSAALHSSSGVAATGDVQHRISKRTTLGANYQYTHFGYSQFDGGADIHSASGSFSHAFSSRTEFSLYAGGSRLEVKNQISTAVDPVIAVLLGIRQTTQIVHYIAWTPTFGARISRRIPQGILYASVSRGITPGNGLFLTSEMLSVTGGYSYTGLRRWSASVQGSYYYSDAKAGIAGTYAAMSGGFRLSRMIGRGFHFVAMHNVRQYNSARYGNYQRFIHEASVGLGWTPGELPLRIW
jgi:hypothetical protein